MRRHVSSAHALLGAALVVWPTWLWWSARLRDGASEVVALVPLAVLASVVMTRRHHLSKPMGTKAVLTMLAILAVYAAAVRHLPPLVCGILAFTALSIPTACTRRPAGGGVAIWGLFMLCLPVIPSLQFYAGYPLRRTVAVAAACMLRLSGFAVTSAGSVLEMGGERVCVDAPCSGIRMLWTGAFLVCTWGVIHRARQLHMLLASAAVFVLVLAGNVTRACILFLIESGAVQMPDAASHEVVGLVVFSAVVVIAVLSLKQLGGRHPCEA